MAICIQSYFHKAIKRIKLWNKAESVEDIRYHFPIKE